MAAAWQGGLDSLTQAIQRKRLGKLSQKAFMGDQDAMGTLMGLSPQHAQVIQQQQGASQKKSRQVKIDALAREKFELEQKKLTLSQSKFDADQKVGDGFEGTAMTAQISNMLDRGVTDPEFRKTPDYARAYQLATAPNFVDTPKGRIPIYPELPDMFQPPEGMQAAPRGVVPGTEKEKKYTVDQDKSYGYSIRMTEASDEMEDVIEKGFDPASGWQKGRASVFAIGNYLASEEFQLYNQAATNWVTANLRQESGAAIGVDEMENEKIKYFPVPGDTDAVIAQKKRSRKKAAEGMRVKSGRERGSFEKEIVASKGEIPPPKGADKELLDLWKFMSPEDRAKF